MNIANLLLSNLIQTLNILSSFQLQSELILRQQFKQNSEYNTVSFSTICLLEMKIIC